MPLHVDRGEQDCPSCGSEPGVLFWFPLLTLHIKGQYIDEPYRLSVPRALYINVKVWAMQEFA